MQSVDAEPVREAGRRRLSDLIRTWHADILRLLSSRGTAPDARASELLDRVGEVTDAIEGGRSARAVAALHASDLETDFDLGEVVAEYALVHDCIATVLEQGDRIELIRELRVLHRALDAAVLASIERGTEDREHTERTLRELAERRAAELSVVLDRLQAAVVIGDQGGLTRSNLAAGALIGAEGSLVMQDAGDLAMRLNLRDANTDELIPRGEDPFTLALRGMLVTRDVKVRHLITHQELVVRSIAAPIRVAGDVIGAVSVNIDMTEHKRLEDELRRREHHQRFLADATKTLFSCFAYPDTLEEIARLAVPALGDWCIVDVIERDGTKRVAVAHRDPAKLAFAQDWAERYPLDLDAPHGIARVIRTGEPLLSFDIEDAMLVEAAKDEGELALMRELGPRSFIGVPLVARGRTLGAISIIAAESGRQYGATDVDLLQEIGRRAGIAVDNARLYLEAQEAIGMREEVLAVVSHDLKNPLSAIRMAAFSLIRGCAPGLEKHADVIERSAQRMERMIKDLLDMASVQVGRLSLERTRFDPATLMSEVFELYEPLARNKGIKLDVTCLLEGATLDCDRSRVMQVFGNLLDNAMKFCSAGDEVHVHGEPVLEGARFVVRDTGPGIPAPELSHLFEPYWSAKRHAKLGTGLGLYISKGIVEAHGGRLWVESTVGEGATFRFTLPLV